MMKLKVLLKFSGWLLLLSLTSCAKQVSLDNAEDVRASIADEMGQAAINGDQFQKPSAPSEEIMNELMPVTGVSIPGLVEDEAQDQRFDISVANAPAGVFFMSLVADTGVNMVVHPSVSGTISLDLKKVTIDEVMKLSREVYGYEYRKSGDGYIVLPARIQSKIFQVNYLNVSRDGESSMTVSSGQIQSSGTESSNSNDNTNTSSTESSTEQSSSINTSSKANFWQGLHATVTSIVGQSEGRSVVVDSQAGLVIVRAMPGELRDVEAYLTSAQLSLQRQVIIEAKIIEVQLNDNYQSGIDWAALATKSSEQYFVGQAGIVNGSASAFDSIGQLSSASALPGFDGTEFANLFAVGGATDDFGVLLKLLNTQGEVQVLSSPRVSTLNNQKAVIKVGTDEFFVTNVQSSTTSGATTSVTIPEITLTPFFSGIALDVTPQVSEDDEVILHIHPSVSEVNDQIKNVTVGGQVQQLPLALSTVRESDSVVKALSGQVVVIGGLMQNRTSNEDASVPVLSSIPLIGGLFNQTRKVNTRSELVILLRPVVVGGSKTWSSYIRQSQERIEQLQQSQKKQQEIKKEE